MPPTVAIILVCYAVVSLATVIAFAIDKRAARLSRPRTRERTLHLFELLGGFPGALIAIFLFRHKNRKPPFYLITVVITGAHAGAWWYLS